MKKIFLFSALIIVAALSSCANEDNKNEVEHYPTYDTTATMENINNGNPDSSSSNEPSNDAGEQH